MDKDHSVNGPVLHLDFKGFSGPDKEDDGNEMAIGGISELQKLENDAHFPVAIEDTVYSKDEIQPKILNIGSSKLGHDDNGFEENETESHNVQNSDIDLVLSPNKLEQINSHFDESARENGISASRNTATAISEILSQGYDSREQIESTEEEKANASIESFPVVATIFTKYGCRRLL